jgi:hypothetical protein
MKTTTTTTTTTTATTTTWLHLIEFNSTQLKFELNSMKPNKIEPNSIKCV